MSRTLALTQKTKGLGRRNFALGYPRSHATPTPTSRSKGQKSRWGGGILWRQPNRTACLSCNEPLCRFKPAFEMRTTCVFLFVLYTAPAAITVGILGVLYGVAGLSAVVFIALPRLLSSTLTNSMSRMMMLRPPRVQMVRPQRLPTRYSPSYGFARTPGAPRFPFRVRVCCIALLWHMIEL